uniref:C-type lectin domain-containing protein n=1 Tax=Gadus morhua TaxID=8049 RepID=A0A8C5CWC7_GADMO
KSDSCCPVLHLTGGLKLSAPLASPEYHYYNQTLSWSDARSFCLVKHSDLATVTSMEEAQLLAKTAAGRGDAWIGLRFIGTARWLWSDGSGALSSSYWDKSEPNFLDGPNPCAETKEGGWNDLPCSEGRALVCQGGESKPFLCDLRFKKFHLQIVNRLL